MRRLTRGRSGKGSAWRRVRGRACAVRGGARGWTLGLEGPTPGSREEGIGGPDSPGDLRSVFQLT